jgi:hypothetical protein
MRGPDCGWSKRAIWPQADRETNHACNEPCERAPVKRLATPTTELKGKNYRETAPDSLQCHLLLSQRGKQVPYCLKSLRKDKGW